MNRLFRSRENRIIAGVASGLARFFAVDVTLVRLLWVLAAFVGGGGVLAYLAAWIVIPEEKKISSGSGDEAGQKGSGRAAADEFLEEKDIDQETKEEIRAGRRRNTGLIFVGLGLFFLARQILPRFIFSYSWPVFLIIIGLMFLWRDRKG